MSTDQTLRYASKEVRAEINGKVAHLWGKNAEPLLLHLFSRPGPVIGLELNLEDRLILGLPSCGHREGGTMLCLVREGIDVPLPSAPTNREELENAQTWPLAALPLDGVTFLLPEEQ